MVLRSPPTTRRNKLSPCSHEEVDARMMVHIADAVQDGHQSVMIRSTDTDMVVLAVAAVATLEDLKELWVSYGTGKNHQILLANLFAKALGLTKSKCLPIFHALTVQHNIFLRWVWKKNSLGQFERTFHMLLVRFSSCQGPPIIFLTTICAP